MTVAERSQGTVPARGNVMISAAGRRVSLLRTLEASVDILGLDATIVATDINALSAAFHAASRCRLVPAYGDPGCLEGLIRVCREEEIGLVVPTIDPDLGFYAEHREALRAAGIEVMLSHPETIRIAGDKLATHEWLTRNGFPTVGQASLDEALSQPGTDELAFPVFVKPRHGSSSIGARTVGSLPELRSMKGDLLVQSLARGREYTVDVYVDREGTCRCAVPRLRLETRGGEVSKGMTVRLDSVRRLAIQVAERLPGAHGVLNVQIFHDPETGDSRIIEINPRFGGGYPLSHRAGAHMARWMLEERFGLRCTAEDDSWEDGVIMLRYDDAIFTRREAAGIDRGGDALQTRADGLARE